MELNIELFSNSFIQLLHKNQFPILLLFFFMALGLRVLLYHTVMGQFRFIYAFGQRVKRFSQGYYEKIPNNSFEESLDDLLQLTFHENYELKTRHMRRKGDFISSLYDRLLGTPKAAKKFCDDLSEDLKVLPPKPQFSHLTENALQLNPHFNRIAGISTYKWNRLLNSAPMGLLFLSMTGTLLGLLFGLPELYLLDPAKMDQSQLIMVKFVESLAFSLKTTILGLVLALISHFTNQFYSLNATHQMLVNRLNHSLEILWSHTMRKYTKAAPPPLPETSINN